MEKILNKTCDRLANIIIHQEKDVTSDNAENKKSLLNEVETPKKEVKDSLSDEEQKKFNRLITKAKQLASEGEVRMALELSQRALKIWHSEKLIKRIEKMKTYLKEHENEESEESEEDNGMMHVGKGFYLYKDLYNNLYSHQKEGVLWMWGLFRKKKGGILGDDMGLGKTIQVISFLSGLFDMEKVNSVLIVMPVSLISNWEKEFQKWAPGIRVSCFHGSSKREKERALAKVQRRGGVCLTTYGLVVTSWEQLGQQDGRDFVWDYMILDEGHKIKNPTKTTKGVHAIGARNRMILTGTPIQNNLRELWALFDFVHDGGLLGTARTFKMEFDNPITRARERDATVGERKLGMEMAETLKKIIAPYFLRRTKAEVEKKKKAMANNDDGKNEISMPSLTRKNDFIVWLFLTPTQQKIYHDFISLESVKELLMTKKSPLVALTVLKKLCDHPRLLSRRACAQLGLDGEENMDDSALDSEDGLTCAANQIDHIDGETLINESGKLIVILDLLDNLKMEGHRTLLFSQSRKMLNIIEKLITDRGHKIMRLDGTVTQVSERDQRIKKFQTDDSYSVFLLTTQVGGVGLTLTAADRVIIYDPSWNPATDEQAVDRVFRIGQNKNVVIYRLITCGTVEEKIYRRQVFKNSITQQTTGTDKNPYRYFTKQELKELFSLDNPRESKTQQQLEEMHSESRKSDPSLDSHIAYLYSLDIFGLSDHDLMFNQEAGKMDDMDADGQDVMDAHHTQGNDYIQHRVQKAQELIRMESELGVGFDDRFGAKQRSGSGGQGYSQNINFGHSNLDLNSLPGSQADQATKPDISEKFVDLTMAEDTDEEDEKERNFYDHVADTNDQMPEVKREPGTVGIKEEITSPTSSEPTSFVTIKQEVTSPISHVGVKTEPMSPERFGVHNIEDSSDDDCVIMSPTKDSNMTENISKNSGALSEEQKENDNDADSSFKIKGDEETEHTGDLLSSFIAADDEDSIVIDDFKQQEQNGDGNNFPSPGSNSSPSKKIIDYEEDEKENIPLDKSPALPSLSKTKTPSKNNKRKSVARSPWHHKTPQGVTSPQTIREELFISPDVSHPIMNYSPSRKPGRLGSNLNTTIFSAFVSPDSPAVREAKRSKRSLDDSIPSIKMQSPNKKDNYGNALHQTLVTASPGSPFSPSDTDDFNESNKKAKSKLYQTFVCDSGSENELDMSDNAVVADSVPCTPVENHIGANQYIGETDEEDTPKIIRKDGNCDFDDEMVDSPIQTTKSSRHKKAVIASSDEESDSEEGLCNVEYSENHGKEKTIKHVNDSEDDDALESPAQTVSSDDEDCLDTNKNSRQKPRQMNRNSFLSGQAHAEGGSSDEETDEEETDLSGFIVNSDDEEMDSEEDVEEADISLSDVGNSHEFKSLSSVQQQNFEEYIKKSRSLLKKEKYEEALHAALQAVEICPEPVVQAFALKIHQHMDK